jgi:hypothetical protein
MFSRRRGRDHGAEKIKAGKIKIYARRHDADEGAGVGRRKREAGGTLETSWHVRSKYCGTKESDKGDIMTSRGMVTQSRHDVIKHRTGTKELRGRGGPVTRQ